MERSVSKVLLVGWEGADWNLIQPLCDRGRLPNLARLMREGVSGKLASPSPLVAPLLWTSLATGQRAPKHGVTAALEPDAAAASGVGPVSTRSRRTRALWGVVTHARLRSVVVGWPVTHPAEPIHGVLCSDEFPRAAAREQAWSLPTGSVSPARRAGDLARMRVHPDQLSAEQLAPFAPLGALSAERRLALASGIARDASVHAAITYLMERESWTLAAARYSLADRVSRHFLEFHPPRLSHIPSAEYARLRGVVARAYEWLDEMLGCTIELAGPDTAVFVVSDHGFHTGELRPGPDAVDGVQSRQRPVGVLCARGPGIRRSGQVYGAQLVDVMPTILQLLGLSVSNDLDGRLLRSLLREPIRLRSIRSWEHVAGDFGELSPLESDGEAGDGEDSLESLVRLGYVERPSEDAARNACAASRDGRLNLALAHLDAGEPRPAAELLRELLDQHPADREVRLVLAEAHLRLGDASGARTLLPDDLADARGQLLQAAVAEAEGDARTALERLERAEAIAPGLPQIKTSAGRCYLSLGRWSDAMLAFLAALERDGDSAAAYHGLSVALLKQKRPADAATAALRAVGLQHFFPEAHFQLGVALSLSGRGREAVHAFETCLTLHPDTPAARRWLALLSDRAPVLGRVAAG